MRDALRITAALAAALCLLLAPSRAQAGVSDLLGRAAEMWKASSLGADSSAEAEEGEAPAEEPGDVGDEDGGEDDEEPQTGIVGGQAGLCLVPQEPPRIECELGSGFLCVSTPAGGVDGASFILKGTIDRQSSAVAGITISSQNEYTKGVTSVDTSGGDGQDCWSADSKADPFCLDAQGRFAARIELPEVGPYTVSVTASRMVGDSVERKVRTSRVIAPTVESGDVTFDPDIKSGGSTDLPHVRVTVDLLGDCQFCDFIGASTGGVALTVENTITDSDGHERSVDCSSTVEQGGQGRFSVGVPVGKGANRIFVRACNAATEASCPSVGPISFTGTGPGETVEGITFLSPDPLPTYDSGEYPKLDWRFRIAGEGSCVSVRFNRIAPIEVCPDEQGVYSLTLEPRVGINVATIAGESGMEEFAWTFGWGKALGPHGAGGGEMEVPSAVELAVPARTARDIVLPLINNFLASDERDDLIEGILGDIGGEGGEDAGPSEDISAIFPHCSSSDLGGFSAEIRGAPKLGGAVLKGLAFGQDTMELDASISDVEIGMDLVPEKDLPPLPLVISIRKALIELELASRDGPDGLPVVELASPYDDCDYKAGSYCKHMPAALIPKNLVGGANSWGGFVKCDRSLAEGKAKEACDAINSLNAQTGLINEKVLDAINQAIYCGGSTAATALVREGVELPPVTVGQGEGSSGIVARVRIPLGFALDGGLEISSEGILAAATLMVGDASTYSSTPGWAKIPEAGVVKGQGFGASSYHGPAQAGGDLGVSLSLDAANAFLFAATAQGDGKGVRGLMDIDVHEGLFGDMDFDFVSECDAFEATDDEQDKPTLCHIRPRVSELLGTALTTYGYFPGNQPLMAAVRANRALGLRVAAVDPQELPAVDKGDGAGPQGSYDPGASLVSIELGGVTLAFYALQIDDDVPPDEYGNPATLVDDEGRPVILSMNPDDPDPLGGQIISFDLTLLAAVEIGSVGPHPEEEGSLAIPIRLLADRTRLVLTPMPGTNSTTVPAASLVSQLSEKLGLALSGFSADGEPIVIPVPAGFDLASDDEGLMGALGLARIDLGANGLALDFEPEKNSVTAAVSAIITQTLHVNGREKTYTISR